jgi:hypothetical protein
MDRQHDRQSESDALDMPGEAGLRTVLDESDRDIAAGRTVALADVLAELDLVASETEARRRRQA